MIALNRIRDANVITDKLTGEKLKKALIELLKKWIQFQNGSLASVLFVNVKSLHIIMEM